jgi:hypothetical protein
MIGEIERVPLREVWKHEAHDFTTWLQNNLDIIDDVLDLSLVSARREQAAGAFSVDLVAEDEEGNTVIIENQLERSDHDHPGKLITYLAALEARVAIWIVSDPRPDHVGAISWLNESSSADFYLLKVEAIRIDESRPAPLVTLIVGPSAETRKAGETKRELAERHHLRQQFWSPLLDRARARTQLHANRSPGTGSYLSASAGKSGLEFIYAVRQNDAQVELYIDRGKNAEEENEKIFWFPSLIK